MQLSEPQAKMTMVALLRSSTRAGRLQRRGRGKEGVASRSLRSEGGARRRERRHEVARGAERDDVETGEGRGELDETEYFRGLVTSPFKEEDRERDLITPTVKFVGRAGIVLFVLFLMFMKSNGLL